MPRNSKLPVWACKKGHVYLCWEWSSHAAALGGGHSSPPPSRVCLPCALLSLHYRSAQAETLAMALQPSLAPALAEGPQVTEQYEISPQALPTALAVAPAATSTALAATSPARTRVFLSGDSAMMDPRAPTAERGMGQGPVGRGCGSQGLSPTEPDACHCTPLGNAVTRPWLAGVRPETMFIYLKSSCVWK